MGIARLPHEMETTLRQLGHRSRLLSVARGLLLTAAALLVSTLIAIGIDSLVVLFDPRARFILTTLALASTAAVLVLLCLRPLLKPRTRSLIARQIESHIPALEERWSTVAELAESNDPPAKRGSQRLIDRVTQEALELRSAIRPEHIARLNSLRKPSLILAGVFLGFGAVYLLWPSQTGILIRRFCAPRSAISLTKLTSLTHPSFVARGEPITLQAQMEGRIRPDGRIFVHEDTGEHIIELGPDTKTHRFSYEIPAAQSSFTYSFRAGDGQTAWQAVTVAERPSIAQAHYQITPPAYSLLPIDEQDTLPARVRALQGSRLELRIVPTNANSRLELKYEDGHVATPPKGEKSYVFITTLERSCTFTLLLKDELGLTNLSPPTCRINVYEDHPPTVEITSPGRDVAVRPDEKLPITFEARDDLGVAAAELVVTAGQGANEKPVQITPIPLDQQEGSKKVHGHADLDLRPLGLKHGDRISYAIRVHDTKQADATSHRDTDIGAQTQLQLAKAGAVDSQPAGATSSSTQPMNAQSPARPVNSATQPALASDQRQPQLRNNSTQSRNAGGSGQANADRRKASPTQPSNESSSTQPSGMTMRQAPGQSSESGKQNLLVDKWAGTFDGQVREKVQIAIDHYLARLDAALASAQTNVEQLRQPSTSAPSGHSSALTKARSSLADADHIVTDLRKQSDGTPYAFMGLQLHAVKVEHVLPAERHLSNATTRPAADPAAARDFDEAWYHIVRAREQLADLTRKYEEIKRQEQVAAAIERINKMHRIFVEDTLAMLGQAKPRINNRRNKMIEVSDDVAAAIKEYEEQLKKAEAELAQALANDPKLLRKFLDKTEATILRDELTRLRWRQEMVQQQAAIATTRPAEGGAAVMQTFLNAIGVRQQELAEKASRSHEKMITWLPNDANGALLDHLNKAKNDAGEAAKLLHEGAIAAGAQQIDRAIELAGQAVQHFESAQTNVIAAAPAPSTNPAPAAAGPSESALFIAHRSAELQRLILEENAAIQKMQAMARKHAGRALGLEQIQIKLATMDLADRLGRQLARVQKMSKPAANKLTALIQLLQDDITQEQQEAIIALRINRWSMGADHAAKAVEGFAHAEKLYDEALTLVEKFLAELASRVPPQIGQPPSVEQLLEMLKREHENLDALGAALPRLNVQIISDWAAGGDGEGGGSGSSGQSGSMAKENQRRNAELRAQAARQQAEEVQRQAQAAQREATDQREKMLAQARRTAESRPADSLANGKAKNTKAPAGREFDLTFVSKLEEDVTQSRGITPPSQYREAIESYFEAINEAASNRK